MSPPSLSIGLVGIAELHLGIFYCHPHLHPEWPYPSDFFFFFFFFFFFPIVFLPHSLFISSKTLSPSLSVSYNFLESKSVFSTPYGVTDFTLLSCFQCRLEWFYHLSSIIHKIRDSVEDRQSRIAWQTISKVSRRKSTTKAKLTAATQ